MTRITHRELRNNSSDVLRRVAAGEVFEVTNRGDVVAKLLPAGASDLPFPISRAARRTGGWSELGEGVRLGRSVQEILDEEREEKW